MSGPIERKAAAAPAGSFAGALAGLALYALGSWVYHGPVPADVAQLLLVLVPGVLAAAGAFLAAYSARHTPRPDLEPPAWPEQVTSDDGRNFRFTSPPPPAMRRRDYQPRHSPEDPGETARWEREK